MTDPVKKQDVIREIAFIECDIFVSHPEMPDARYVRPCPYCVGKVARRIADSTYIDEDIIETTAIAIANLNGNYVVNRLQPLELRFALRLLEDIIPYFLEKVREVEVRERIKSIQENGG